VTSIDRDLCDLLVALGRQFILLDNTFPGPPRVGRRRGRRTSKRRMGRRRRRRRRRRVRRWRGTSSSSSCSCFHLLLGGRLQLVLPPPRPP